MTGVRGISLALAAGALALIVIASSLYAGPNRPHPTLLRGLLLGFAVWSCVPVGSTTLPLHLLADRGPLGRHRLGRAWTGGGDDAPGSGRVPPIMAALPQVYPWVMGTRVLSASFTRWCLEAPWFALRALVALIGWSALGRMLAAGSGTRLLAGLGLAFFGLTISLVAVDWYLSLYPRYVSSAFAAMIAVQQMLAALALTAVLSPAELRGKAVGDIGGLMIATLLGVVYLEYMSFVVAWYGDLPLKAEWVLKRGSPVWAGVLIAAFIVGALLPFAMLLVKSVRTSRSGLRIAGAMILTGTALHFAWLLAPAFDSQGRVVSVAAAALAALTVVSVLSARGARLTREARHAE